MKRPVGVIVVAIVVALIACVQMLGAAGIGLASFGLAHGGLPAQDPTPLSPGVIQAVLAGTAAFTLLLAGWNIATVVGLLKLRNWGRYSVLVLGGLMATFGVASLLMIALVPSMLSHPNPQAQALPQDAVTAVFLIVGGFYGLMAALGAWWLVYFNLRSVKAYFEPLYAAPPASLYPASLATPGGLSAPPPPRPGAYSRVPTSIAVIACLLLFSALCCAGCSFLPFPTFFAGFVLAGMAGHLLYALFASAFVLIGVGLLRLDNRARLGFYAVTALNLVNLLVLLTPWGHARQMLYNQQLMDAMHLGVPLPTAYNSLGFQLLIILFILITYGGMIFLVERHRALFASDAGQGGR